MKLPTARRKGLSGRSCSGRQRGGEGEGGGGGRQAPLLPPARPTPIALASAPPTAPAPPPHTAHTHPPTRAHAPGAGVDERGALVRVNFGALLLLCPARLLLLLLLHRCGRSPRGEGVRGPAGGTRGSPSRARRSRVRVSAPLSSVTRSCGCACLCAEEGGAHSLPAARTHKLLLIASLLPASSLLFPSTHTALHPRSSSRWAAGAAVAGQHHRPPAARLRFPATPPSGAPHHRLPDTRRGWRGGRIGRRERAGSLIGPPPSLRPHRCRRARCRP